MTTLTNPPAPSDKVFRALHLELIQVAAVAIAWLESLEVQS